MKKNFLILTLFTLSLTGCSVYTFNPKGKSSIKSIAVERLENKTSEFGLEDIMTDQIIDAFIANGNLKVVEREYADAVLSGSLTRYLREPYNPDENDRVENYAIKMYFDITLLNAANDSLIWNAQINQTGIYNLETETEETGQNAALKLLVEDIINRTTKNW